MPSNMSFAWERPHLYPKQEAAFFNDARYSVCEASTKAGKAQPLDATVQTPGGPKLMGGLRLGDVVLTPDGQSPVIGIFPQGEQDVYRVTFSDGTSAECTEDHLWEVHADQRDYRRNFNARLKADPAMRRRSDYKGWPRVMPLRDLMQYSNHRLGNMWVPQQDAVAFDSRAITVDPYLLGVLLGDGCLRSESIMFSTADPEIVDSVARALPEQHAVKYASKYDYRISLTVPHERIPADRRMIPMLKSLGLWGKLAHQKFVPNNYRYNSVDVRLAVLQGLMDTDGTVDKHGQPSFASSSLLLAEHVAELVRSLGGIARVSVKQTTHLPCYCVRITIADGANLFRLTRKNALCRPKRRAVKRMFRSIEKVRRAECQCIKIADPRGVYLTSHFIATHNTFAAMVWLFEQVLMKGGLNRHFLWGAPWAKQAEIAYNRYLAYLGPEIVKGNDTKLRLHVLPNHSYIDFRSLDNEESVYGEDYYAAVMDEFTRTDRDAYKAVESTLTATEGPLRLIGNVLSRGNWGYNFARMAEQAMLDGDPDYHYVKITAYDAVAAGILSQKAIDQARRNLPDQEFRALYLAEPPDDGGNPFGLGHIAKQTMPDSWLGAGQPFCSGIDFGRAQDFTVVTTLDQHGDVVGFERFQADWKSTITRVDAAVDSTPALCDSTGIGDVILAELQDLKSDRYEGYVFSMPSKQQLMQGLAVAIQQGEIRFPDGPIRQELDVFAYEILRTGVRYSAPNGLHDDCVMSLALAVHKWHELTRQDLPYAWLRNDPEFQKQWLPEEAA